MTNLKPLFWIAILISLVIFVLVYGIYFDQLPEGSMMQIAYVSVFLLVFGASGLVSKSHKLVKALVSGFAAVVLLLVFHVMIFPSL